MAGHDEPVFFKSHGAQHLPARQVGLDDAGQCLQIDQTNQQQASLFAVDGRPTSSSSLIGAVTTQHLGRSARSAPAR